MQAVAKGMEMGWIDQKLVELIHEANAAVPVPPDRVPRTAINVRQRHIELRESILRKIHDQYHQLTGRVC